MLADNSHHVRLTVLSCCVCTQAGEVLVDSAATSVWRSGPLTGTLDGYLLEQWHSGRPFYDAVFVQQLPAAQDWLLNTTGA